MCTIGLVLPTPPEIDEDASSFDCCAQILGANTIAPGRSVTVNLDTQPGSAQGLCTVYTSEMIHHRGASLSKQQTADLLLCHGTQQDLSLSTV